MTIARDGLSGFWDVSLASERKAFLRKILQAFSIITAMMLGMLSWYFGSYFRQEQNLYRLTVRVIDLDSAYGSATGTPAILGPIVHDNVQTYLAQPQSLGWQIESDTSRFVLDSTSPHPALNRGINASEYATHLVLDQTVFAAIVVNGNATSAVRQAAALGEPYMGSTGSITLFYEEARNYDTVDAWLVPKIITMLTNATSRANVMFTKQFLSDQAGVSTATATSLNLTLFLNAINSGALAQPFGYNEHNLRPFDRYAGTASTTVGAIYLIIFTFFIALNWSQVINPLLPKVKLSNVIILRILVPFISFFWISLHYSLVSLAFHVSFDRFYGRVGFVIYWMLNWLTMSAVGFVMEIMLTLIGPLYFAFFLIFWVIIQVSGVFLDLSDMDHFYLYNFILPVWNQTDASKSLAFGTKNHLAQNFLVIMSWVLVDWVVLSLITTRLWKEKVQERREQERNHAEGKEQK